MLRTHGLDFMIYEFLEISYWLVCMYVYVYILFSGEKDFHQILSIFEFKRSHSTITISMEKHDIYNQLSQYFLSPFVPHLWPFCLNLLSTKKKDYLWLYAHQDNEHLLSLGSQFSWWFSSNKVSENQSIQWQISGELM